MKKILLKIYNYPLLSKEQTNANQKIIRDTEWEAIKPYIIKGKFLDVGCGAGYAMNRAQNDCQCEPYGIDPDPMGHGVGREGSNYNTGVNTIKKAFAESIPFDDKMFETVYSSHVLEHVNDEIKSLQEMKRVLKDNGVLIIGMPTAAMAAIHWVTAIMFTRHHWVVNFIMSPFINVGKVSWREFIIPDSHSHNGKSLLYDLKHYKIKNWQQTIEQVFTIEQVLLPALYPYPEYRQWFKFRQSKHNASSVFFICKKKN